jgi:hypothetical protein
MSHPLDGAYLKISRAREHLKLLKAELALTIEANPCEVVGERDSQSGQIVLRMRLPKGPFRLSPRLGLLAGDAIHNLRSALDHLAYQLAVIGTGPGKGTQFPIFENPDDYRYNEKRLLEGIAPRHRTVIESVQPYHARKLSAATDPLPSPHDPIAVNLYLMALGRLDNMDKHRSLLPRSAIVPFTQPQFEGVRRVEGTYPGQMVRVEDGAELYRITALELLPGHTEVKVKTQPTYGITFGDPEFGPMGTPTDIWSNKDKVAAGRADIAIAANMVEKVIAMFIGDF